jgi:exopolyphosphatase/guanosine-5'-triphosphate,3'-diphosphate pyrophosphatase
MICGIVDLGSNTIRLSIYQCEPEGTRLLMNRKTMAGLAGYVEDGAMSSQGIQVACQTLKDYHTLMENFGFHDLHVFATASLRNISNTEEAVQRIQKETGLMVDVISGSEEARLSFTGAVGAGPENGLLIDLGGGSTELVQYQGHQILSSCSLSLGSLSLFSRYVSALHPTPKERKAIRAQVTKQLEEHVPQPPAIPHACGVGGTARAACKVANLFFGKFQDNRILSADDLHTLCKQWKHIGQQDLHLLLKCVPDRIHTLIPGMLALDTIARAFALEDITISPWGVREGYLRSKVWKETVML